MLSWLLGLGLAVAVSGAIYLVVRLYKTAGRLDASSKEVAELNRTRDDLLRKLEELGTARDDVQRRLDELKKYEGLPDVEREAARLVEEARKEVDRIASDTAEAREALKKLEREASALKNVIDGYGDQYVVPAVGLMDELAERYGFADAGQRAKEAQRRTRTLIKEGLAARCDYVEANRKQTAIDFVLDAFNGKVDSILSEVSERNFGTLQQQVLDAFTLVNKNGQAFRNARITDEYLTSRLDELKWGVALIELRRQDKEEQRRLREQIREEERAQREFERAQKEAAKEEDMLRKAMEKARKEAEKATEEERAKFEQQLRDLGDKLKEAEAKNQRALSMAQQTRAGHVYIISNLGSFGPDVLKIGMTRRLEPEDRIRELGDASVPFGFDIHALIRSDDAPTLERELHKSFMRHQVNKVNPRKEFFRVEILRIREEVERLGVQASWSLTAEAREYRESLAVERGLQNSSIDMDSWEKQQLDVMVAESTTEEKEP